MAVNKRLCLKMSERDCPLLLVRWGVTVFGLRTLLLLPHFHQSGILDVNPCFHFILCSSPLLLLSDLQLATLTDIPHDQVGARPLEVAGLGQAKKAVRRADHDADVVGELLALLVHLEE